MSLFLVCTSIYTAEMFTCFSGAGTSAQVSLVLVGDTSDSGCRKLFPDSNSISLFDAGTENCFVFECVNLGPLDHVRETLLLIHYFPSIFHMEKENILIKRVFFTKFSKHQIYIQAKMFHP